MVVLFEIYKRNQEPLASLAPAWKPPLEGALSKWIIHIYIYGYTLSYIYKYGNIPTYIIEYIHIDGIIMKYVAYIWIIPGCLSTGCTKLRGDLVWNFDQSSPQNPLIPKKWNVSQLAAALQ